MKAELDRVYFTPPIEKRINTQKEKPVENIVMIPRNNTTVMNAIKEKRAFIEEELTKVKMEGFAVGAIVVERMTLRTACLNPYNWGIVVRLNETSKMIDDYKPIVVEWINRVKHTTYHTMDSLYQIHSSHNMFNLPEYLDLQDMMTEEPS